MTKKTDRRINTITLYADPNCPKCHGLGMVYDRWSNGRYDTVEMPSDCDCAWDTSDASVVNDVDDFIIMPHPDVVKMMEEQDAKEKADFEQMLNNWDEFNRSQVN